MAQSSGKAVMSLYDHGAGVAQKGRLRCGNRSIIPARELENIFFRGRKIETSKTLSGYGAV